MKFNKVKGNHPIMNEDNWDVGDLHYQIYASVFGFDVHPRPGRSPPDNGDYSFTWQPSSGFWYFISVAYQSTEAPGGPYIRLAIDDQFVEDSTTNGKPIRGLPQSASRISVCRLL